MTIKKQLGRILSVVLALTLLTGSLGLLTNAEITTDTTTQVAVLSAPANMDVSMHGANLITDSTVGAWDGDAYATYYSSTGSSEDASTVGNQNAWWDRPASFYQRYEQSQTAFGSLKENGSLIKEETRTADGSGAIKLTSSVSYLPVHTPNTPKYYLYTFWAKASADATAVQFTALDPNGTNSGDPADATIGADWTPVALLLTAGKDKVGSISVNIASAGTDTPVYIDDVSMFELEATYAEALATAGAYLTPDDAKYATSTTRAFKVVTVADDYDFTALGENLALDPTVSKFNPDGTYDTATGMKGDYGATNIFVPSDAESPTSRLPDDSGVVYYSSKSGQPALKIADKLVEPRSYYLITFFIKCTQESESETRIRHWNNVNTWNYAELTTTNSTEWQRVTYIVYTGSSTGTWGDIGFYQASPILLDDFGVYKLSSGLGGNSFEQGKLFTAEELDDLKYATSDTRAFKVVTAADNYNFTALGKNLALDPTVSKFNPDGTYDTTNGMKGDYGATNIFIPPDAESPTSRLPDDSGVVYYSSKSGQPALKIADKLVEPRSYYLITFFIKCTQESESETRIRHWNNVNTWNYAELTRTNSTEWQRVTYIVYTGSSTGTWGDIGFYQASPILLDDFGVYKLSSGLGGKSFESGTLLAAPGQGDSPEQPKLDPLYINATKNGVTVYDYADFDFNSLGNNLIPDSTVKEFEADGTYKAYYADETTGTGVANANAWWGKAVNNNEWFGKTEPAAMWASPKTREMLSNDSNLSHTADGSGVIVLPGRKDNCCIPLCQMDSQSYYVITFWANIVNGNAEMRFQPTTASALNIKYDETFGTKDSWQRVTMLVYTGKSTLSEPNISFYSEGLGYIDDVAVYKLDNAYGAKCAEAGRIIYKRSAAIATPNVDGYDFTRVNNLVIDGSFEKSGVEDSSAKFDSKVFNVTAQNNKITLPKLSFTRYYLVSYYVKTEGFASSDKVTATMTGENGDICTIQASASNGSWERVTAIVSTGDYVNIDMVFDTSVLASGKAIYIDGLAVHALPTKVASAAAVIDAYQEGVLNAEIINAPKEVFGQDSEGYEIWQDLVSPVKSTATENFTYASLFVKYNKDYEAQEKISRGFAPSGYGTVREYSNRTCDPADNLIANPECDDANYWADPTGFATITTEEKYEGTTSLKVSGEGLFLKKLTVKPNTTYYLSLRGKGYSDDVVPHIHFGIMDVENQLPFENPKTAYDKSHWAREDAYRQEITIKYSDGTWYNRIYQFNTGENNEVYFFIKGIKGETYFDKIEIFEAANSKSEIEKEDVQNIDTTNSEETRFACDDENNLIPNGMFDNGAEFWGDFNGMDKFVEVVTSDGNKMLHYKGAHWGYYYLPKVQLEANKTYTFSFWYKTLNGENATFGIVSLDNPRSYITTKVDVTSNRGEWTLVSITFDTFTESEVALAVYDKDGEAVFDKVRLFESKNGYALSLVEDMPKGGNTFSDSKLGTDGLVELEDPKQDTPTQSDPIEEEEEEEYEEEYEEEEEEEEETEENVKKVLQKYKKKGTPARLATWFIILMIVVAVVVLAGITFLIIFLAKRKKA